MANQEKITLYWLEQSRSQRIVWLLETLQLTYTIKTYPRVDKLAPPELKQIHPLGKSPILTIETPGRETPVVLAESGFIAEYLVDHYGPQLAPQRFPTGGEGVGSGNEVVPGKGNVGGETEEWLRYRHLLHFAEGSMMPYLVLKLVTQNIRQAPVPFFIRPITNRIASTIETAFVHPNITNNLDFLEGLLSTSSGNGTYLCGSQLTAADIVMSFPLLAVKARVGLDVTQYPKLSAYIDLLEKEPTYVAAVKKIEAVDGKEYSIVQ